LIHERIPAARRMNSKFADRLPPGWERFSRFFFALGDTTRQQILLVFEPGEEICVNDIARLFKISRPAVSHHLKVLRNAELLLCEKRGKAVYYRVNHTYCAEVMRIVHDFVTAQTSPVLTPPDKLTVLSSRS
jgi:DNA-binding transcriptional ArsR family regulator